MAIMNYIGDIASPWKMPLWIFTSSKQRRVELPAGGKSCCQFHSPGFHGFLDKGYDFIWYFVNFEAVYYLTLRDNTICLFAVNPCHGYIFLSGLALVLDVFIYVK